ncbi:MAG TPA: hypothetical protein VNZ86_20980, partial [Bacteroidia bacterium]|nr:hypothetical protein [Bacteroidia bacterium]
MSIVTAGIITAAGAGASYLGSQEAQKTLAKGAQAGQVNIPQAENLALGIGGQNAAASQALQNQYQPWAIPLQNASNTALTNQIAGPQGLTDAANYLTSTQTNPLNSPVQQASINAAGQQLALGGTLGQDTQNAVTRAALSQAGGVTQGGLGLGRDVTAQDLGLTSLQLQNQRIQQGLGAGQQEQGLQQANLNNTLNRINTLSGLTNANFGRAATAAQIGNSIQAPATGINPGSAAGLYANNASNMQGYYSNLSGIQGQEY